MLETYSSTECQIKSAFKDRFDSWIIETEGLVAFILSWLELDMFSVSEK